MNEAACQERCRRTALRRACDNTWRSRAEMRARGSAAWELSVGAEQGRRARGLVIYRLAALLWCSDAVGRLHVNEAACQERCRRTALRRACDNTWRSRAEMRAHCSGAWRWSRERSRELSRERSRDAELVAWSHIYRLAAMLWCSGAVGRSVARERGSLSRAMQAHCFAARV